ncbi:MAG TPA: hypothetical protein VI542_25115, partial [Candidatus Tectomicrobia bacterium]
MTIVGPGDNLRTPAEQSCLYPPFRPPSCQHPCQWTKVQDCGQHTMKLLCREDRQEQRGGGDLAGALEGHIRDDRTRCRLYFAYDGARKWLQSCHAFPLQVASGKVPDGRTH